MVTTITTTTSTTLLLLLVLVLDLAVLLDGGHAGRQGHTATAGRLEGKHGGTGEGREGREKNEASTTGKRTIEGGRIGVKSAQEKADREWGGRNGTEGEETDNNSSNNNSDNSNMVSEVHQNTSNIVLLQDQQRGREVMAASLVAWAEAEDRLTSLVHFLVSSFPGRQVVLLHDTSSLTADVRCVAEGWWRGWGSLSVYLYSQRPGWVKEALEVGQQGTREGVRKVVVVCSTLHTLHILRQVRDNTLESVRLRWYVVLRGEVDVPGVLDAVREGTQVS
ncbi:hypothetical protein Pcinc_004551 [Petrolisthes cinctipes]|uniref:Receptor ligand binding region domain-containing protein n=1 Tax=Petrolisthes cinctipes TaxID=88211 RepID=A0AAE1GGM4_PETCI|nr:hypothetical protein Pcinc_004551 [Petrolisthes cinctipes]